MIKRQKENYIKRLTYLDFDPFWNSFEKSFLKALKNARTAVCPKCHEIYQDKANTLSIEHSGECLNCDHLYMTAEELDYDKEDYDRKI